MKRDGAAILAEMADTFRNRAKVYGDSYLRIGPVLAALFPNGLTLKTAEEFNRFHLYMMMVVKVTRLAATDLKHEDSAHDSAVYAAMLQSILESKDDEGLR